MRVLFASLASAGHTYPMIPLAVAARDAGHEVHWAAGEHVHSDLSVLGVRPFRPADSFYEIYAEDLAPDLERLRPDLVVHGWGVPGAAAAARAAGIPGLWHGFGRMFPPDIGLSRPDFGSPHVDICPISLQDKEFLSSASRIALRPVPFRPGAWERPAGMLIYVTFGTAFGTASLLSMVIPAVARLASQVVVATGRVPVASLGPLPSNVTAHSWVPQAAVVPHASVVVHHGGSGTTLGALAAGVPQLVLPQGADQFANAAAVVAAGVGLAPAVISGEAIGDDTLTLLASRSYREAARALAAEIALMPSPASVARRLGSYA
ncbi:glycosyl transferase [Lentzea sp. NBRC 105346]|uniref:glycosyltransferase n=1 Tax=Lentzea sp. NBRC 105346 TaxID=3032205 RepID=UPI0024A54A7C|nr:nucleotide disphospho-sugar-binding domain-containing protein [Lentzea sp. NBRC 105346]GLZ33678.1 glycosyl transferase [Lentzea sp. NBRC 105346]